ncbi:DUF6193 family natural product biosynthesis protein [Streptomyces sp. NPDC051366]|uniref:DUF6193 family natural product biosynthesis protein n=1 Tax=Streptomyces sp. NPDC051366 TaxID=3365652 RepID=UPI003793478A
MVHLAPAAPPTRCVFLVEAASAEPRLRVLSPGTSVCWLRFSCRATPPICFDLPLVRALGNGHYEVRTADGRRPAAGGHGHGRGRLPRRRRAADGRAHTALGRLVRLLPGSRRLAPYLAGWVGCGCGCGCRVSGRAGAPGTRFVPTGLRRPVLAIPW